MSSRVALSACCLALNIAAAIAQDVTVPKFVEETNSAGVDHTFAGQWEYMVGGGVAAFDCDSDGFSDMLLAGGERPSSFYRNASPRGGSLRFEKAVSGLEVDGVVGAYPLDVDSDGLTDLALLRVGENILMRGLGGCRFEPANEAWGFDGGDDWSTAFSATWEDGHTWPTLAVGNYLDRGEEAFPWGSCTPNWLHRPAGTEARRFTPPTSLLPSFCALSMLFTEWDRSGRPSLRVSNDREYYKGGQEQLWRLAPGSPPVLVGEAEGWKPLRIWGMGIAGQDLDADGYPEYFLTSMADNKLQKLANIPEKGAPQPTYLDVAYAHGVTAHRPYAGGDLKPSTAWHAEFADVNNDGLADLFVAKGNVWAMPDFAAKDPNNLLVQRADGIFAETGEAAGVISFRAARGAALTDFNLDGLVDLVVVNRHKPAQLWRNATRDGGHWIQVRLQQPGSNRDAIGAWVELRRGGRLNRRELTVGGGHAGGQIGWLHFGLGEATEAEVRVIWPDGAAGGWQSVKAQTFYLVERGQLPSPWSAE
jgi:enediyne biosynthesis protein E4